MGENDEQPWRSRQQPGRQIIYRRQMPGRIPGGCVKASWVWPDLTPGTVHSHWPESPSGPDAAFESGRMDR